MQYHCEISGDIGFKIRKDKGERRLSCVLAVNFRGAAGSRSSGWRERQPGGIPLSPQHVQSYNFHSATLALPVWLFRHIPRQILTTVFTTEGYIKVVHLRT